VLIACVAMADRALPAQMDGSVVILAYDFSHRRVFGRSSAKYDRR
jgi:hypothetical protein